MRIFLKLVLEFLPLGLFFIFTTTHDIFVGTTVLMIATAATLVAVWMIYRKMAWMAIINAVTGIGAGLLTLVWTDPTFVKMKPTVISLMFAGILLGGLASGRALLKPLIGEDLNLTEEGWAAITLRWGLYFIFIAILNEIVWRGVDVIWGGPTGDTIWAGFKAMILMPLTVIYAISQLSLLNRYRRCHDTESLADFSPFVAGPGATPVADRAKGSARETMSKLRGNSRKSGGGMGMARTAGGRP